MQLNVPVRAGAAAALALTVSAAMALSAQASPVRPATTYCKIVTAQTISVFDSPGGNHVVQVFSRGTPFYVDRTDAPKNRYHLAGGSPRWTTSDPSYVKSCG